MYKQRRGNRVVYIGKAAWLALHNPNPAPAPKPQNNAVSDNAGLDAFRKMTEAQQVQAVADALRKPYPPGLPKTDYQKVAYYLGLDGKANMVDSSEFDSNPYESLYRVVHGSNWNDTDGIVANVMLDDNTFFSDSGGSAYGRGIYFTNDMQADIRGYSYSSQKNAIIRAKLSQGARTITYSSALNKASSSGFTGLGINYRDIASIWAVANGYDALTEMSRGMDNYHCVLTRKALDIDWTYHKLTNDEIVHPPAYWDKLSR